MGEKCLFIFLFQCLFILILYAKILCVNWALSWQWEMATLGLIHTRHFDAQYCDIAITIYFDKKTFFSQYFSPVWIENIYFCVLDFEMSLQYFYKKMSFFNFLLQYLFIFLRPNSHKIFLNKILQYCDKNIFWFQSIDFYWTYKVSS